MTERGRRHIHLARIATLTAALAIVAASGWWPLALGASQVPTAQPTGGAPSRLTIPYLAPVAKPDDLDFTAAQCDVAPGGQRMDCRFRQVYLTVTGLDSSLCAITTNGYERTFHLDAPNRWTSTEATGGACGLVETTTLEDGGLTRWTMTIETSATRNVDSTSCRAEAKAEVHDWRTVKRRLPCTFVQPGAIER